MIGIEHGDPGREPIERAAVRIDHACERAAHGLRFGGVEAEPSAAGFGLKVEDVEAAPRSGDNNREPAGIAAAGGARPRNVLARRTIKQLQTPLDGFGGIARFDRLGIGGIDEGEPLRRVARPNRRRQPFDQSAE